ncbi:MAG: ribosome recycling factor [Anaerolineae bacterium]
MTEESEDVLESILQEVEEDMEKAALALQNDLRTIRTGRASPALVEWLKVDYYGTLTPLNQLASIAVPEPRLLTIRPWDPGALGAIEKAILKSDLGLTPNNDGKIIRLSIPRLTEERRKELVKLVARRVEEGKVAIRNCRRDGIEELRQFEKEKLISEDDFYQGKEKIQELTDKYIEKMDGLGESKKEEILEV